MTKTDAVAEKKEPAEAEEKPKTPPDPAPAPAKGRDHVLIAAIALAVVAALVAGWFGWSAYSTSHDDSIAYGRTRDDVLRTADQAIANLNTLDYRNVTAGLGLWQDSTTSELYDQIVKGRADLEREVAKNKTTTTARILESGLTELDTRAGKAAVMAAVRITVTGADGKSTNRISRLAGQLTKTSSGWKLSALGQAPTGTSGS
ncbi:hypothetical protein J4573_12780 [Actinomadura barringtoniae]|uniref:Mce-associated membrane protein n=1 Tax=Actinomadura barringtoniae TaxID=1427535 RepID=A0A939P8Q0_9ACTN|nr:hypothetical protein [Actinomadura barringtoniae]MBO2447971.1 hypothetical protein [Actinomadura barringtoniae]